MWAGARGRRQPNVPVLVQPPGAPVTASYPSADLVARSYECHINSGQARLARILGLPVEVSAEGTTVYDQTGAAYLDCGGYGVLLLGHRHPAVVAAVVAQLHRQPLSTRLFLNAELVAAAEALKRVVPIGLERVTFTNSGSEAVELALKLGRSTGRRRVIAMMNGFHGKTLGALSVTGRERYRASFAPLLPDVVHVAFGDACELEDALAPGEPATVIVEPVQAEGGVQVPKRGYLASVRESCDRHGAMFVADEIQTGLGRLGMWWGVNDDDVRPDVLLVGKSLGGGVMPAAAVVSTAEAYAALDNEPLLHSSTFAGNPLAAVAARTAIETIEREDLVARAARLGDDILTGLRDAEIVGGVVKDVRGRGLLIGIEFEAPHEAARFLENMLNEGVIVSYSLNADNVARLTPPAVLSNAEVDRVVTAVSRSVSRIEA